MIAMSCGMIDVILRLFENPSQHFTKLVGREVTFEGLLWRNDVSDRDWWVGWS